MSDTNQKTLQYRQIDFLRLFRLCRDQGIVRRKRKMPAQYERASHVNSSCSKLFKSFLTGVFEDLEIRVDNRRNVYTIVIPREVSEKLSFIRDRIDFIRNQPEHADIFRRYEAIEEEDDSGFIALSQYSNLLSVTTVPNHNGRYAAIASGIQNINCISRPREEYFRCARACLAYKAVWNEHIGTLCSWVDEHREDIERGIAEQRSARERERLAALEAEQREQQERLRAEIQRVDERRRREREERERQRLAEEERVAALEAQAQEVHRQNRERAQQLFNNALEARRGGIR